jgi:hypothetical protein
MRVLTTPSRLVASVLENACQAKYIYSRRAIYMHSGVFEYSPSIVNFGMASYLWFLL